MKTETRISRADGKLVALIEMILEADHLLIENVAVSPGFQGKGLGPASLGHSETKLYTNKLFAKNVQFYQKLGYGIDREEEFKGGFVVHMSKAVQA
jgi:GNAT superfamily N-acetyltransferase